MPLVWKNVLFIIFSLIVLAQNGSGSCPWPCLCFLKSSPITVNCSGLHLNSFPIEIDIKVQWLDLNENGLQTLPNLDNYNDLRRLYISQNKISRIASATFKKQFKLEYLDLSHNLITDWSHINFKDIVQYTNRLKTLNLSYNSFTSFNGKDKGDATSFLLEELFLKACGIKYVDGQALTGFRNLKYLDLSSNPIKWLNDLSSPSLVYLDLSFCDIDSMSPNALNNLPSLGTLKLIGNTQFAINHGNLTSSSLQNFEASYCSLTTPGLYGFPNLTYANLRGNKIISLKDRVFIKNKLMVELDLSANEIKHINPLAFIGARQLAFINLSTNSLRSIPWNTFSSNYNLKTLDLSVNRLEAVGNLSILQVENLDLSQCLIREIRKDSLTGLPWLMNLNLSRNPLEKIPNDIQSWYLRDLDLSYCRISTITNDTFKNFPELCSINLIGNRFTIPFKVHMFDYNDRLDTLRLGDNPWICDCESQDFKYFWEFLTFYPAKLSKYDVRDTKCMSPDDVAGKSWIMACTATWYPDPEPELPSIGLAHYGTALIILLIIVGGIFAVIGAIKHGINKRMKQQNAELQNGVGRIYETHARVVYQEPERFDYRAEESPEPMFPRSVPTPRGRTDSQLTQPPTYEEAVQMLSGSREDVVSRDEPSETGAVGGHSSDSETGCGEYSIGSDLSDDEQPAPKRINIVK